jgi:hypothetical protein
MDPSTHADGHDGPGSIDELVPSLAAVVDDVVIECEDSVRQTKTLSRSTGCVPKLKARSQLENYFAGG